MLDKGVSVNTCYPDDFSVCSIGLLYSIYHSLSIISSNVSIDDNILAVGLQSLVLFFADIHMQKFGLTNIKANLDI